MTGTSCQPAFSISSKAPQLLIRALDHVQNFLEAVFLRVAMECLLGDADDWSLVLEYRLKSVLSFDPTVG